jgi:CHAT domain-containing protein
LAAFLLARTLRSRYERTASLSDLLEALNLLNATLDGEPGNEESQLLAERGSVRVRLYEREANTTTHLDSALVDLEAARHELQNDSRAAVFCAVWLTTAYTYKFLITGEADWLDRARDTATAAQKAYATLGRKDADWYFLQSAVGHVLTQRYSAFGVVSDLDDAIETLALLFEPPFDQMQSAAVEGGVRTELGWSLYLKAELETREVRRDLLQRAYRLLSTAVELTRGSVIHSTSLFTLGVVLRLTDPDAVDRAESCFRKALAEMEEGHLFRARCLTNLGIVLTERSSVAMDDNTATEATQVLSEALGLLSEGSPMRANVLASLGDAARKRAQRTASDDERHRLFNEGSGYYSKACQYSASPALRLQAAGCWLEWAASQQAWRGSREAAELANSALTELFEGQAFRAQRERALTRAPQQACSLAYTLAKTGDFDGAVEAVEKGRAILLAETLRRRQLDVADIAAAEPALWSAYDEAAQRLEALEALELSVLGFPGLAPNPAAITAARRTLKEALGKIHDAGWPELGRALDIAGVREVATPPLVYVLATPFGGLALCVDANPEVTPIWLEDATTEAVEKQVVAYAAALEVQEKTGDSKELMDWVAAASEWCWAHVMNQVLAGVKSKRLVLIATGKLALLPLHAARNPAATTAGYAIDDCTLTFAPGAGALDYARTCLTKIPADERVLIVENPTRDLKGAKPEADRVEAVFRKGIVTRLRKCRATRERVLREMVQAQILHFACHGVARPWDPLSSCLQMSRNQEIAVRDIMPLRLRSRLAVLSACETGRLGEVLPDEAIGLPQGLLQAGVASAIVTLWPLSDAAAIALFGRFYRLWRMDGLDPVEALREAQLWLRDATRSEVEEAFPTVRSTRNWTRGSSPGASKAPERAFPHPFMWAAPAWSGA